MADPKTLRRSRLSQLPQERWLVVPLMALGLPMTLLGLGSPALYDPHESLYAEVAREMVVRGDWLTPHLNGTRYLDKPPLLYWLIAVAYTACGVSELSARLPTALASLSSILLTWGIGRYLFDDRSAALAGLVLTTSVGTFVFSRQLMPDMVFACFTTLSFYGFVRALEPSRHRQSWSLLAYSGLALAVLTKGFVGLFPLLIMATYAQLLGGVHAVRQVISLWGGMLFTLLILPWHLIMGWQNEGYFWHYFVNEHILRFLGQRHPLDFVSLPLSVFVLVLFVSLLPWSPYLALVMPRQWPWRSTPLPRKTAACLIALLWGGMFLTFFALSQARLPQYALPAMPALALLVGVSLEERFMGKIASTKGLLAATAISILLPTLALLSLPSYLDHYHQLGLTEQALSMIRLVFGLMLGGTAMALVAFARKRWLWGLLSLTVSMAAAFACTHQVLLLLQPVRTSHEIAKLIEADQGLEKRLILEVEKDDPFEYEQVAGLAFYTRQPVELLRRRQPPEPSLPLKPTERFLLSEAAFRQLWTSAERVYLVTDSFLDDDGILDRQATFSVLGRVGKRTVVSNRP